MSMPNVKLMTVLGPSWGCVYAGGSPLDFFPHEVKKPCFVFRVDILMGCIEFFLEKYRVLRYNIHVMKTQTIATSIRISKKGHNLLKRLSESLGISQTAVIEMAIRTLARKEKVKGNGS